MQNMNLTNAQIRSSVFVGDFADWNAAGVKIDNKSQFINPDRPQETAQ